MTTPTPQEREMTEDYIECDYCGVMMPALMGACACDTHATSCLRNRLDDANAEIDSLRSELREAKEALEPFAKECQYRKDAFGAEPNHEQFHTVYTLTVGDLRRAARALAGKEKG